MARLLFRLSTSTAPGLARGGAELPPVDRGADPRSTAGETPEVETPRPDPSKRGWRGWLRFFKGPAGDPSRANLTDIEESMLNLP